MSPPPVPAELTDRWLPTAHWSYADIRGCSPGTARDRLRPVRRNRGASSASRPQWPRGAGDQRTRTWSSFSALTYVGR